MNHSNHCSEVGVDKYSTTGKPITPIWIYFKKLVKDEACCTICQHKFQVKYGNTSSLKQHLQRKHAKQYRIYEEQQIEKTRLSSCNKLLPKKTQLSIVQSITGQQKWDINSKKQNELEKAIGKFIASGLHTYKIVDEKFFKEMINNAAPNFTIPGRKTFSRRIIPALYKECYDNLALIIASELPTLSSIAFTTDIWTSGNNVSFLALTGHFVTDDFIIQSFCLGISNFVGQHTGEAIQLKLKSMIEEWGLDRIVNEIPVYCVTDNATNMKAAISQSELHHLSCFAHSLQLVIKDARKITNGMDNMLAKARAIVGHFKHSPKATELLGKKQEQMGRPKKKLIQDCETRWNSEYSMLNRLIEEREPVSLELLKTNIQNLSAQEWQLAQGYKKCLEPLYEATLEVSSSRFPTRSKIIPIIHGILSNLNFYLSNAQKGEGITFARNLLQSLHARFPSYENNHVDQMSMLLDPRFKNIVLTPELQDLSIQHLKVLIREETAKTETGSHTKDVEQDVGNQSSESSLWSTFKKLATKTKDGHFSAAADFQVDCYFSQPTISHDQDPCAWWRENIKKFPKLKCIVKHFLGIPATEVHSERVFSTAGNVVSKRRESLKNENIAELVFLHENL